jgi:hypothetical protein
MDEDVIMTDVKILASKGNSVLIEWVSGGRYVERGFIPSHLVVDDKVAHDELLAVIPYGVPWSSIVRFKADPVRLEQELHRVGIWTLDDITRNPNRAIAALQSVYSVDYAALKAAARTFSDEGE